MDDRELQHGGEWLGGCCNIQKRDEDDVQQAMAVGSILDTVGRWSWWGSVTCQTGGMRKEG